MCELEGAAFWSLTPRWLLPSDRELDVTDALTFDLGGSFRLTRTARTRTPSRRARRRFAASRSGPGGGSPLVAAAGSHEAGRSI